jgi:hypothetical protein
VRYAERAALAPWAAFYNVELPNGEDCDRLLDLATGDVIRHLGAAWDPVFLDPDEVAALSDATAIQACFRAGQGDAALGLDDGLASVGGMSFSLRVPPRFSPEAAERVAGHGLLARTGTSPR